VQSLKLFLVNEQTPEVPVLKVVTINWVDSIRSMAGYTSEHGKFWETSLSNLESIFEFWFTTASDAWQHYANFLDQAGQKHQKAAQRFFLRANQAAEAARIFRENEEFEARPSRKVTLTLKGPMVSLEAVMQVPNDAKSNEITELANNLDPSAWRVIGPGVEFPSVEGVRLSWKTIKEEPAAK
jgi:hypothetical protein